MKKIILFISLVFCSLAIKAQDLQNYQAVAHMIDSMEQVYGVNKLVNNAMITIAYQYRDNYKVLSEEYQNKVITRICGLFDQKQYLGLYSLASVLLDDYYDYSKENIKKRIIEIWYDKRCYDSYTITSIGQSKYYSDKTKQRLLDILEKRWTPEDIAIMKKRTAESLRLFYMNDYKKDAKKIMLEINRQGEDIEKTILDSLIQDAVNRNMRNNINRPVSKDCILMIGSLNDRRFVPLLEKMIEEYTEDEKYPKIKEACTYALAKLGVPQYIEEVYKSEYIPYTYLGTKEAYLKWLDKNFVWNKSARMFSNQPYRPSAIVALESTIDYNYYLINVPSELKTELWNINFIGNEESENHELYKEKVERATRIYNWIKNNPDKWEIPPAKDSF